MDGRTQWIYLPTLNEFLATFKYLDQPEDLDLYVSDNSLLIGKKMMNFVFQKISKGPKGIFFDIFENYGMNAWYIQYVFNENEM